MKTREHLLTNQKLIAALGLEGHSIVSLDIKASVSTLPTAVVEMHLPASAQTVLQELELVPKRKPVLDLDAMARDAKARLSAWIDAACTQALRDMQQRVVGDVGGRAGFFEVTSLNDAQPVWVRAQ